MVAPLFLRVFFSRSAVIAGVVALAAFALYREPEKLNLLKNGAALARAVNFCESVKSDNSERQGCLVNFQKLRQFSTALGDELEAGTFERCVDAESAGNTDKVWACLRMADQNAVADRFKRPY
jgi:hypothetical protein